MNDLFALLQLASVAGGLPIDPCSDGKQDEIVICGSRDRDMRYRLPPLPDKYERKAIRAETELIPGVKTRAHVQSERRPDGYVVQRALVTFSIPF